MNLESVEELREHKGSSKIVALIRFFTPLLLSSMFFTKEIAKISFTASFFVLLVGDLFFSFDSFHHSALNWFGSLIYSLFGDVKEDCVERSCLRGKSAGKNKRHITSSPWNWTNKTSHFRITSEPLLIPFIHAFMASIALNAKGSVILDDGFPPFISLFTNLHYKYLISSQPLCNQSPLPFW